MFCRYNKNEFVVSKCHFILEDKVVLIKIQVNDVVAFNHTQFSGACTFLLLKTNTLFPIPAENVF